MSLLMWLVGVLTGIGGLLLYQKIKAGKLIFKAYQWVVLAIWYLAGIFVIGFIGTSLAEGEPQAAGMATLIFGGLFLVLSILVYRFVFFKSSPAAVKSSQGKAL
jgi:hypothetical protein